MDILTGRWIPVERAGTRTLVSYVDLIEGRHDDAAEIAHPIPEMRVWTRMLLGALTQALCPMDTDADLRDVVRSPTRVGIPPAFDRNRTLLDSPGGRFMQPDAPDPARRVAHGTSLVVFDEATTYGNTLSGRRLAPEGARPGVEALCPSCALIALYGLQAHAPQGGRGYSPCICGSSRFSTLPVLPSLRASAHALTLTRRRVEGRWPAEGAAEPPWRYARRALAGDQIGLTAGLFWTPRTVRWEATFEGPCALCGEVGARVALVEFAAGSKVLGAFWPSPWTPWRQHPKRPEERWHVTTPVRPAWAELGGLVAPDGLTRLAPAVEQCVEALGVDPVALEVYGSRFNQTKWLGTTAERATLHVARASRAAVLAAQADAACGAVRRAVRSVPVSGGSSSDAVNLAFWRATESAFHAALAQNDAAAGGAQNTAPFERVVRKTAWTLFAAHTRAWAAQPRHVARVAEARRALGRDLRRAFATSEPPVTPEAEQ